MKSITEYLLEAKQNNDDKIITVLSFLKDTEKSDDWKYCNKIISAAKFDDNEKKAKELESDLHNHYSNSVEKNAQKYITYIKSSYKKAKNNGWGLPKDEWFYAVLAVGEWYRYDRNVDELDHKDKLFKTLSKAISDFEKELNVNIEDFIKNEKDN